MSARDANRVVSVMVVVSGVVASRRTSTDAVGSLGCVPSSATPSSNSRKCGASTETTRHHPWYSWPSGPVMK
jgi:hypothetical protein